MRGVPPTIAIDCRMINSSGIGSCIKGWLPHVLNELRSMQFILLGNLAEIQEFPWAHGPNVILRDFHAPIYSLREQFDWLRLSRCHFDLVWVPHFNIPYFCRSPLLVTVHDLIFLRKTEIFGPATRVYAKLFLNRIRHRADAIFFVSEFTRREFLQLIGPPPEHSSVIHNGIDELWFAPPITSPLPTEISDRPYILFVGNVKPHKNISRLISAFSRIQDKVPHRLLIVGAKDGFATNDRVAKKISGPLADSIKFTGFLPDETLRALVSNAAFLVFPSLYEGFGLPPLEALASGIPVVASRIPAVVETCGDLVTYFDPYDVNDIAEKLMLLCTSPPATPPQARIRQFRWSESAARIVTLIHQTLRPEFGSPAT